MSLNTLDLCSIGRRDAWLLQAGQRILVAGPTEARGGDASTWKAAELLLGALASCASAIITATASERGLALTGLRIQAESSRDPDDRTRYRFIRLHLFVSGIGMADAESLVHAFKQECPIYGTLARGAPVAFEIQIDQTRY